jgi:hypothetical protein
MLRAMIGEERDRMKSKVSVSILLTSPMSLVCPYCKAKPNHGCVTNTGNFAMLHLARVEAASLIDKAKQIES